MVNNSKIHVAFNNIRSDNEKTKQSSAIMALVTLFVVKVTDEELFRAAT